MHLAEKMNFFFFQKDGGEVAELRVSGVCFWIRLFFSKQHMGVQTRTFIRLLIVKVTRIGHLSEVVKKYTVPFIMKKTKHRV